MSRNESEIYFTDFELQMLNDHSYSMHSTFTVSCINVGGGLKQRLRCDTLLREIVNNDICLIQETKCDETDEEDIKMELEKICAQNKVQKQGKVAQAQNRGCATIYKKRS